MPKFDWFSKKEEPKNSSSFTCHSLTCSFSAQTKEELEKHELEHETEAQAYDCD